MRIIPLEDFKEGKEAYIYGDIRTVSDEDGKRFCDNGWAKDEAGEYATGEREGGPVKLDIQNSSLGHESSDVGGK